LLSNTVSILELFGIGYGCLIPEQFNRAPTPFKEICQIQDEAALDLLSKMLELDHKERITAEAAMKHEFFNEVRDQH